MSMQWLELDLGGVSMKQKNELGYLAIGGASFGAQGRLAVATTRSFSLIGVLANVTCAALAVT